MGNGNRGRPAGGSQAPRTPQEERIMRDRSPPGERLMRSSRRRRSRSPRTPLGARGKGVPAWCGGAGPLVQAPAPKWGYGKGNDPRGMWLGGRRGSVPSRGSVSHDADQDIPRGSSDIPRSSLEADEVKRQSADDDTPLWILDLQDEMAGNVMEENDFEEDRCALASCAPRLLTAGGYNRHHYEGEVRMHVRACVCALRMCVCIMRIW